MLSRVVLGLSLLLIAPPLLAAEAKKTPLTPGLTPVATTSVVATQAAPATIPEKGIDSGLPLPRFVSLASEKVNARTGPGSRYPIAWQYQRRGLPVEVVAEYEYWRRIRDHDGTETWVHKNLTSGKRYATVEGSVRSLYKKADTATEVLLTAEPGVQARVRKCPDVAWCQVEIAGTRGWMPRAHLWGIYPSETFD